MTDPDELEKLARAAEAALALPGAPDEDDWFMPEHFARLEPADAAFISLASPATILALLSANREMRSALEEARTLDRGFYEWLIERDLIARGEEVEWGDIVVALTEHEIEIAATTQRGDGE